MSLHVEVTGAGPDLVLLHGWGLHGGAWGEVVPALAGHARVHTIDLPGHGHSQSAAMGDFDGAVDLVAAHVPAGAIVCGWSMGGLFAQRLARRHPSKVRRLALVGSTPRFVATDDWPHGMRASTLAAFGEELSTDITGTLDTFVKLNALNAARSRDSIREFASRLALRPPPTAPALAHGLAWLRETDLRIDAPWIAAPALVMHGSRDALAPVAAGRWLAQAMPQAQLVVWEDAGHLPFFTHREAFVAALEAFVA
jgi:pimeloyl-[acyl-carrier protein] methyl ester esterase